MSNLQEFEKFNPPHVHQPHEDPKPKTKLSTILIHILLMVLVVINIFPLYWMLTFSLKSGKNDPATGQVNEIQGYNYTMDKTRWQEIRDTASASLAEPAARDESPDARWERVERAITEVVGDVSDIAWTQMKDLILRSVTSEVRKADSSLVDAVTQEFNDNWEDIRASIAAIDGLLAPEKGEEDRAAIKSAVEAAVVAGLPSSPLEELVFSNNRWKNIEGAINHLTELNSAGVEDPWAAVKDAAMANLDLLSGESGEAADAAWDQVKTALSVLMGDQAATLDQPRTVYVGPNLVGLPRQWTWANYANAMKTGNMGLYFLNSLVVAVSTIIITIIAAFMATYAMTRLHWRGRKLMNKFFMLGLTIPIHAAIVPVYIILSRMKLLDTYVALILPYSAFSLSMAILISIGFMGDIPYDLDEAAFLDGCGEWGIFFRVILPLMLPATSTVGIYTFLQCWNELLFANIFLSKGQFRTLPVGVQQLFGQYTTDWGPIGAALSIATLPTLIVYVLLSKKIQAGFIAGAVKG